MNPIKGVWQDGHVLLEEPADWPDGTSLLVEPAPPLASLGLRDEDWPTDPDGIVAHLARMDQIQPLEMTSEEESTWRAARKTQKEYDMANFERRSQRIEGTFR